MTEFDVYSPPEINIYKLAEEFRAAGLPIDPDSIGWRDDRTLTYLWMSRPSPTQLQSAADVVAAHDPDSTAEDAARIEFHESTKIVFRRTSFNTASAGSSIVAYIQVPLTAAIYADMIVMSASSGGAVKVFRIHGVVKRLNGDPVFVPPGTPGAAFTGAPFADTGTGSRTFTSQIDPNLDRLNFVATGEVGNIDWSVFTLGVVFDP